jgi:hypothetical protein
VLERALRLDPFATEGYIEVFINLGRLYFMYLSRAAYRIHGDLSITKPGFDGSDNSQYNDYHTAQERLEREPNNNPTNIDSWRIELQCNEAQQYKYHQYIQFSHDVEHPHRLCDHWPRHKHKSRHNQTGEDQGYGLI